MKEEYNNFYKTSDGEQIFYSTNFPPGESHKGVLVFNYGLVCSNHHWTSQIEYFDKAGYKILLHDYRGHYQSSGRRDIEKINFTQLATDLNEIILHLDLKESVFFGHSMGVNVCLEYAKLFEENLKKMILISGTILPVHNVMLDSHMTGVLKPITLEFISKFPRELNAFWKFAGWHPLMRKLIKAGGFNVEQVSDEFVEIYLHKIGQLGPDLFFQLIEQMHVHDILAFINKIKVKTLIIGGNKDKVIPNYLQKLMHSKLSNSEMYIIHSGSHVPQVDFSEETNERIEFFLEAN